MKYIVLVLLILQSLCAYASDLLSPDAFTAHYVKVIEAQYPDIKVTIKEPLAISIAYPDGGTMNSFLDNAYIEYQQDPDNIDSVIVAYASGLDQTRELESAEFTLAEVMPVIKDISYIEQVGEMLKEADADNSLVYEPLNEELFVVYVFDTPTSIRFMTQSDLVELGVEQSSLREAALTNLQNVLQHVQLEGDPASLSMLVADGMYEASMLLFDGIWSKQQFPVKGDIVVYVPARDVVLITGSEDIVSLATIQEILFDKQGFAHPISNSGFVFKSGKWEHF